MSNDNGRSVVGAAALGVLIGGAIGALAGILFAPASGQQTRRRIREKSAEIKDSAVDLVDEGRARVEDFIDESRDRIGDFIRESRSEFRDLSTKVRDAVDEGRRAYSRRRDELRDDSEEELEDEAEDQGAPQAAPSDEPIAT